MKKEVKEKLTDWFGTDDEYGILHWWNQDGTYLIVVKNFYNDVHRLHFVRIFPIGVTDNVPTTWHISVDHAEDI